MNPNYSLPVLLVSACDRATAEEFISELIDNEVTDMELGDGNALVLEGSGRVWRLVNKYYSADVLVSARGDADLLPDDTARVEAHVAYFTPEECDAAAATAVACAQKRACSRSAVRVAALRAEREGVLGTWAAGARYEPVTLLSPPAAAPPHEAVGVARVREALHAHPWPGLRRLDRGAPSLSLPESDYSSSGGSENCSEDEEEGVERAEEFVAALGALGDAGTRGASALGDAERRQRAEQLLTAFCRALGHRLD